MLHIILTIGPHPPESLKMKTNRSANPKRKRCRCETVDEPRTHKCHRGKSASRRADSFDPLPDDLVIFILSKVSSTATSPTDLTNILITCKRMNNLGQHPQVLHKASAKSLAVRFKNWSDSAHRFLKLCADAGNLEACYTLGMIQFYCLQNQQSGAILMARAAMSSHAAALYSLAIIQFNGSGGSKRDKNLGAGVALCARAASSGHVDALRELGHCLQDGYGVRRNITEGRKFLIQANTQELASVIRSENAWLAWLRAAVLGCPLLSDYGYSLPPPQPRPANRFLVDWFETKGADGLRVCSYGGCGRPETRENEFRRCSACGTVSYCSRACQAMHWKIDHWAECTPLEGRLDDAAALAEMPEVAQTRL